MKKETVIEYFGSQAATARALGIKQPSVAVWPDIIPIGRAYQIQAITNGDLVVNPEMYQKESSPASP